MEKAPDYATGKPVDISKPEEGVRQAFEKILVRDYGYPKSVLDIEVPIQMGSSRKQCDIAVYAAEDKRKIIGIIETKAPGNTNGWKQLLSYMSATASCRWGALTNGDETHYAVRKGEEIEFAPAFSLPEHGSEGASLLRFEDLREASDLKWIFQQINHSLYANSNLPRTEKQGAEMSRLIFCKLADEYRERTQNKTLPHFQVKEGESSREVKNKIRELWNETKKGFLGGGIFGEDETLRLDDDSLMMIVSKLQAYSLLKTDRDVVGDAFEVFAERQFAGEKGQFFTPRNVVNMVVEMLDPQQGDTIIDPACGSGGFLIAAFNHMTRGIRKGDAELRGQMAGHSLYGIDKDADLVKICRAQMAIIGDGKSNIVEADSLQNPETWSDTAKSKLLQEGKPKQFDVVVTNPPFGSNIKIERQEILLDYDLGRKWKTSGGKLTRTDVVKKTPPQVLFIEQCINLLKDGGKLGIVLPDELLGNGGDQYIRRHIKTRAEVLAVVDCPVATFMPHTGTKTSVLILQKKPAEQKPAFFAIAENCGHTMRGKPTGKSDFEAVAKNYGRHAKTGKADADEASHLGFRASVDVDERLIWVPRYYDPRIVREIEAFNSAEYDMPTLEEMTRAGITAVTGIQGSPSAEEYEIGGEVRFIRTSDISGYEIAGVTQKNVANETYEKNKNRQDLQRGDILFIKDGDTKIGECAILLRNDDLRISVQSHFKKIRPKKIDPFLLLLALNHPIVKKQIRQRVFSQSTLSTIGERINELKLPLPKSERERKRIAAIVKESIETRRERLDKIHNLFA